MLKRLILVAMVVVTTVALLAGCGDSGIGGASFGGDVLKDKAAIKKAYEEMKAKGGSPLKIFQHVNIGNDFISFSRQDQNKPENVDEFIWTANQGWQSPKAVKLTGSGDLEDNIYDSEEVNWEAIPTFVANAEKKAKEEGIEKATIDGIQVYFSVRQQKLSFSTTVKSERKEAFVSGDVKTGEITSFIYLKDYIFCYFKNM